MRVMVNDYSVPMALKTYPEQILGGPILRTLLKLSVPTMIAMAFHTAFNFVDRLFVSRLGELEFGALGMAFTVQSILIAIGSGTGIGTASLIARHIGASRYKEANNAAEHTLLIILLLAALVSFCGPLLSGPFFRLLGASEAMLPYILGYINIILYGSFFQLFTMIGNGILRGEGNTVTPMRVMVAGTLVNIILDPVLIFGLGPLPALGVRGAALATVAGRGVSGAILAVALFRGRNIVRLDMKAFRFSRGIIRGIFAVGGPTVVSQLTHSLGLSLLFVLIRPYGDMAKAAFTMGFTYQQIAILPLIGLAGGNLTMTGQNYGARNPERIALILRKALLFSLALMSCFSLLFILGRGFLPRVFSSNAEVVRIGKTLLVIFSRGVPPLAGRIVLTGFFQGLGKGFRALFLNLAQMVLFAIPLALLLSLLIGLEGVWTGIVLGNFLSVLLGLAWTRSTLRALRTELAA
jgi:putative MATE family efflux protein